jgi:hypothetical protein
MPTGGGRPQDIAARLDSTVGQERMPLLDQLEAYRKAAEAKAAVETGVTRSAFSPMVPAG